MLAQAILVVATLMAQPEPESPVTLAFGGDVMLGRRYLETDRLDTPIVTDGDLVLAETGAIFDYLLETYGEGRLEPARGTPARLRYQYWMHAAEGSVMNLVTLALFINRMESRSPFFIRFFRPAQFRPQHLLISGECTILPLSLSLHC